MKKRAILIFAVLVILIGGILLFRSCGGKNEGDKDGFVTRGTWVSMLSGEFGMETHQSDDPYYSDVPAGHDLFHPVQASAEWGVLSVYTGRKLEPGKKVTCEEVAGTAAIAAGFPAERAPSGQGGGSPVEYAVQNGIVDAQKELSAFMTTEECEAALQAAKRLYLSRTAEEKAVFTLNEGVIDLCGLPKDAVEVSRTSIGNDFITFRSPEDAVMTVDGDGPLITVTTADGPVVIRENNVVIVNPTPQYPTGTAYKVLIIQEVSGKAAFATVPPTLSDIYEEIDLHAVLNANLDDIIWGKGVSVSSAGISGTASEGAFQAVPLSTVPLEASHTIGGDRTLEITVKKGAGGKPSFEHSFTFGGGTGAELMKEAKFTYPGIPGIEEFQGTTDPWTKKLDRETEDPADGYEITGTLTLHRVQVVTDVSYRASGASRPEVGAIPESVSLQLNTQMESSLECKGDIKSLDKKIGTLPVLTPVPGLMVSIDLSLVADLSGNVTLEATLANSTKLEWAGAKLKRAADSEMDLSKNIAVDLDFGASVSGVLSVYRVIPIIDLGVDFGGNLTAEAAAVGACTTAKENGLTTREYTISAKLGIDLYAPIIKLTLGSEDTLCRRCLGGRETEVAILDKDKGAKRFPLFDEEWVFWRKKVTLDQNGNIIPTMNTYTTRYGTENPTEFNRDDYPPLDWNLDLDSIRNFPAFEFDYPDNWSIKEEYLDAFNERVVLQNDRGAEIHYLKFAYHPPEGWELIKMENVSESNLFIADEDHNEFIVAKVNYFSVIQNAIDTENNFYALLESSTLEPVLLPTGEILPYVEDMVNMAGGDPSKLFICNSLGFSVRKSDESNVRFTATFPNGQFTPEEEQEVIAILSSFRLRE